MCYAGVPYCDKIAYRLLERAKQSYADNPSEESYKARIEAQEHYDGTPTGQEELKLKIAEAEQSGSDDDDLKLSHRLEKSSFTRAESLKKARAKQKKTAKVYRAGEPVPSDPHFEDLDNMVTKADSFAPEGRQTRREAIFASPDAISHARWVIGTAGIGGEGVRDSYELEVDKDNTYVYPVEEYESASRRESQNKKFSQHMSNYWRSGIKLSCWEEWEKVEKPERGSWEVLVSSDSIESYKKISSGAVITNASAEDNETLNRLLRRKQWFKGNLLKSKYDVE